MKSYKGRRRLQSKWVKALAALILVGVLCFAALLGAVLQGSHDHVEGEPKIMVILGCQVKPWGPSILLQDRINKAADYLKEHPEVVVVASGGQGPDEHMTEAQAIYDALVAQGIDGGRILQEDRSHNTIQNLRYSMALLEREGYAVEDDIVVVSNGFHLTRVRMLWNRIHGDDDNLSTLAAPSSHIPSRYKMYIREPIALVKSFILDH